jgi:hypothetical protein
MPTGPQTLVHIGISGHALVEIVDEFDDGERRCHGNWSSW